MTRFENEDWGIVAGDRLNVFVTPLGRLAVLICYDSEFPLLARAAVEAGAQVLLVPSCTETMRGYWRVRLGSQARALEGQCYAVHSPTVGEAAWSPAVDHNRGAAGIYGPPDRHAGFAMPEDGVLAIGEESGGAMGLRRSRSRSCRDLARRWRCAEHARLGVAGGGRRSAGGDCRRFDLNACHGTVRI